MKKISFLFFLLFGVTTFAQTKKWTLEECVQYALNNNISIQLSDLDVKAAAIDIRLAIGNFLPKLNADATHAWNIGLNQNITTGLLENQTTQFTSAGFNAGITIYNGLQNQNRLRRANLSKIASQYQVSKIKDDIALNVANAYLQILFNKENIKIIKEQLAATEKGLKRTQDLVDAGNLPKGDLFDSRATIASDKQRLSIAENQLLISKLSLGQLLQTKDFENFDIEDEIPSIQKSAVLEQPTQVIIQKAKENRNEIKIAESNVLISEKDIAISQANYLPSIDGFYSFSSRVGYTDRFVGLQPDILNPFSNIGFVEGTTTAVIKPNFTPILGKPLPFFEQFGNNIGHNFGLRLSIPIFNGLSVRNNVARSKVALERSKVALSQTELDLERAVYTAVTDAKGSYTTLESSIANLEARTLAFNYAKERYTVGMMNAFDYNQAQLVMANAQSEVLRAKYDYIFRTKIVEFYFGIPIIKKQ